MSGFWDLSDGGSARDDVSGEYEIGGGTFELIPNGSSVLALIDEAVWVERGEGVATIRYISLRWSVVAPDEVANRRVYQKLWVDTLDPSVSDETKAERKRDKARRMLAAIDKNAGGKLMKIKGAPDNEDLAAALVQKMMVIRVQIWELQDRQSGETIRGNWVSQVAPKTHELHVTDDAPPKASNGAAGKRAAAFDDEVPF